MNIAIILAGGVGSRLGLEKPKQYVEIKGKTVIEYTLKNFAVSEFVDKIVVVITKDWQEIIGEKLKIVCGEKFMGFAIAGESRQHSVLSGLRYLQSQGVSFYDKVMIHDAARPCVSLNLINRCFKTEDYDGVMPVIKVKDTIYSSDGDKIINLLDRDKLFAGQSPEVFLFGKYFAVHDDLSEREIGQIRGSSEIAFKKGLKIHLIEGEEINFKITTIEDLEKFKRLV